jgi:hypothetical protein
MIKLLRVSRFINFSRIVSNQVPIFLHRKYNTQQNDQQTTKPIIETEFTEKIAEKRKAIFEIASNPEIMKKLTPEERKIVDSMIRVG